MYQHIIFSAIVSSALVLMPAYINFCIGMHKGRLSPRTQEYRFLRENMDFLIALAGCIWVANMVFFVNVLSSQGTYSNQIVCVISILVAANITLTFARHFKTIGFYIASSGSYRVLSQ